MKNFTRKCEMYIEGTNDLVNRLEITIKQFHEIKHQLDKKVQESEGTEDEFTVTCDYKEIKHEHNTAYIYNYVNGSARIILYWLECDEGYVFKK